MNQEPTYYSLRSNIIHSIASGLSITDFTPKNSVFGVIMDMTLSNGNATVSGFIDGNASIYWSAGGGVIGGIGHKHIRDAAKAFVESSDSFVDKLTLVQSCPLPKENWNSFYILTKRGILGGTFKKEKLSSRNHEFYPLFKSAHDLITQLRMVSVEKINSEGDD